MASVYENSLGSQDILYVRLKRLAKLGKIKEYTVPMALSIFTPSKAFFTRHR